MPKWPFIVIAGIIGLFLFNRIESQSLLSIVMIATVCTLGAIWKLLNDNYNRRG